MKEFDDEYANASITQQVGCSVKGTNVAVGTRIAAPTNAACASLNNATTTYVPIIDRSDERMTRTPRKQASASLEYYWNMATAGVLIPRIDLSYRSEIDLHFDRDSWTTQGFIAPSRTFVNARLGWALPDDKTTVSLWGTNLGDNDVHPVGGVALTGFTGGGGVVYAEPRMYGVDAHMQF